MLPSVAKADLANAGKASQTPDIPSANATRSPVGPIENRKAAIHSGTFLPDHGI
jgi:hypothetical protein